MDFEAMIVSNLGDAIAELSESAECFSSKTAVGVLRHLGQLCAIGSETQRPFAMVIVGGIVSGTLFTLRLLRWRFGGLIATSVASSK